MLSLLTPTGPNFIKDFPGQNAINCDLIDAYAGPCLTTHPLLSFNPDLNSSDGSSGKPALGAGGYNIAYYYKIFDQIYMWGEFRFGTSGISAGTGIYLLDIPFTVQSLIGPSTNIGEAPIVGVGSTYDNTANAGRLPLTVHLRTSSQLYFGVKINSGLSNRELRSSGYLTWDINDGVSWSARFQRIP